MPGPWKLSELLQKTGYSSPLKSDDYVRDLTYNSQTVKPGDIFFALSGSHVDGHDFLPQAAERGAVAAVVEKPGERLLPYVVVPSVLQAMAAISKDFFQDPSRSVPVIGITGTNGKTTVTYLLESILKILGKSCAVMGTINYRIKDDVVEAPNTTPQSLDVNRFLARARDEKVSYAVMEVSSHALSLHRVDGIQFEVAVFTNLTQDHLDYHGDMESYSDAKAKLFDPSRSKKTVINVDDPWGEKIAGTRVPDITFGFSEKASLRATNSIGDLSGIRFTLTYPSGATATIKNNLVGFHNISNCLAAAGAALAGGISESEVTKGLNQNHFVPGRLERVDMGQDFIAVVDYAHTPDALEKVLIALREIKPRKLICVFGAGGDRDRRKRPLMGKVASEKADHVILTSDNPRSEDPQFILGQIEEGIVSLGRQNYEIHADRKEAIHRAIHMAGKGDIVLIAGKGHETYQIYGTKKIHFSDQEVAREYLQQSKK